MIQALRILFLVLFLYVAYTVVATSLESNLFAEWSTLAAIPWMGATLKDFYALMVPLLLWMWYRESSTASRAAWTIAFLLLGSIGTSGYILLQLLRLPTDAPVRALLVREGASA
jgi:hypothetical protein